uniref:Uncharacterized protein n=1 Tax=Rhizophora mucronata TaxID=61149 RepID=A0A2P2Q2L5_RHIMU
MVRIRSNYVICRLSYVITKFEPCIPAYLWINNHL